MLLAGTLSVADASLLEGDSGTSNMIFTVTRSGADISGALDVSYQTVDGTAKAGTDYVAQSGTVHFAAGSATTTVAVPILGNTLFQLNRTLAVTVWDPQGTWISPGGVASFAGPLAFATGSNPQSVSVGDFNGDGRTDLVVANYTSNTVSVLLNTTALGATTASFAPQQTFATGSHPESVSAGDFNGDGRPDLAVANWGASTVSVLLNTTASGATTASFAPQQTFATGSYPECVAVGDFNADGRVDLAVANFGFSTVSVLLNTTVAGAGTPNFTAQKTFATGSAPYSVSVGDFNGDGRPDLVVANYTSNTVSVLLSTTASGATTPSFAAQQTFATGFNPYSVSVSDFNADGKPDLAVADGVPYAVSVLLNTTAAGATTPSFTAQQAFAAGSYPWFVSAGDFNADSRADLVVANNGASNVSVLLNTTAMGADTPSFAGQRIFATGHSPVSAAVGDFNADGRTDLVVANYDDSMGVSLLLNTYGATATGTIVDDDPMPSVQFTTASQTAPESAGTIAITAQLSAISGARTTIPFTVVGTASGGGVDYTISTSPITILAGSLAGTITITLVNDKIPEPDETIILTMGTPTNAVLGAVITDTATIWDNDVTIGTASLAEGRSGTADMLLSATRLSTGGPLTLNYATHDGSALAGADYLALGGTVSFEPGQLTSIIRVPVLGNLLAQPNRVLAVTAWDPQDGTASFATQQTFATGASPYSVAVGDFNGDGLPDLAVANYSANTVSVLLNTTAPGATTPSFTTQTTFATGSSPYCVAVGDFNGDGRPDLAVANGSSNTVSVLLNTTAPGATTASFAVQQTFATGSSPRFVATGDFNGDGKSDLAVANYNSNTISVLLNTTVSGAATASFAAHKTFSTGSGPVSIAVPDVNTDGRADLAVANYSSGTVSVLLNTTPAGAGRQASPASRLSPSAPVPTASPTPTLMVMAARTSPWPTTARIPSRC